MLPLSSQSAGLEFLLWLAEVHAYGGAPHPKCFTQLTLRMRVRHARQCCLDVEGILYLPLALGSQAAGLHGFLGLLRCMLMIPSQD